MGRRKKSEIWQEKAMKMPAPNRVYMYLDIRRGAGGPSWALGQCRVKSSAL
jgi:hypothetical protein